MMQIFFWNLWKTHNSLCYQIQQNIKAFAPPPFDAKANPSFETPFT